MQIPAGRRYDEQVSLIREQAGDQGRMEPRKTVTVGGPHGTDAQHFQNYNDHSQKRGTIIYSYFHLRCCTQSGGHTV